MYTQIQGKIKWTVLGRIMERQEREEREKEREMKQQEMEARQRLSSLDQT